MGRRYWAAGRLAEAIAVFRQIAQREPDSADAQFNLGAALCGNGQLDEAMVSLRRAIDLRPSFEAALRTLAGALEQRGREAEAASLFRRVSRLARDRIDQRLTLAKALTLEGETGEAEAELRRAVAGAPSNAGAQVLLGQLLLERGEFKEAEDCLLQAVDTFPDAFQHLAVSRPITEADRPLLARMSDRAGRPGLDPLQRAAVHFGLGKAHNDLGDYAEAMSHFDRGAALCGAAGPLDRSGLTAVYDAQIADHPDVARDRPAAGPDDELPILIVGMPRSGTTLVEQILSSHPDVAAGGELSFWSDRVKQWRAESEASPPGLAPPSSALARFVEQRAARPARSAVEFASLRALERLAPGAGRATSEQLAQAAADYLALLRRIGPQASRVIDKAPFNFERLGQIRLALPHARIVHCRRLPVDTCLSIYFTNYKGRQAWSRADILFHYRQYQRLMAHWRAVLPADRFIEVDYQRLIGERERQTRDLIAFCGLEWDDACLAPERNRRIVKSASLWQARQGAYAGSLDRWRRYEAHLGEFRELLPDGA